MKKILYIHGAFSSGASFTRIREKLPKHQSIVPLYTVNEKLEDIISCIQEQIVDESDIHVISHSLGGVVGVALSQRCPQIKSVLTMGTPFGGSKVADILRWFNSSELFRTLNSGGSVLRDITDKPLVCPVRSIITTVGNNPMMYEPNDGVVTLKSQMAMNGREIIKVPLNHFEVLLDDSIITLIKEFTFK